MTLDLNDDKSTLVQAMAWCRQATSHYLSQCWPRSMSPNGVTRPQRINNLSHEQNGRHSTDDISKCVFANEYIVYSLSNFSLSINQHCSGNGLVPERMLTKIFNAIWPHCDLNHCWSSFFFHNYGHFHIWQASPQLTSGDTYQMWRLLNESSR